MALSVVPDPQDGPPRVAAAVDETIAALACPPSDAAVVALARVTAETIDGMQDGQRGMMLGQTAPLLLKILQELEDRARKRRGPDRGSQPASRVAAIRSAHAEAQAKRRKGG